MKAVNVVITAAWVALLAGVAAAQTKYVAVVETELDVSSGVPAKLNRTEIRTITDALRREAVKNLPRNQYNIMTSETVISQGSAVLEECAEENCVIALGARIGADYIVRGTARQTKTRLSLSIDIYETENGFLVSSSEPVFAKNIDDLIDKAAPACAEMYKSFVNAYSAQRKAAAAYTVTVAVNPLNGGAVSRSPNQTSYTSGTNVSVTATPAQGYEFVGWSGAATDKADRVTITVDGNKALTANFRYVNQYTLTTNVYPAGSGYVTRTPDKERYTAGEQVTVTATPNDGYTFTGWSGSWENVKKSVVVTMNENKDATAGFKRHYTLTINVYPEGSGYVTRTPNKETYTAGEKVIVTVKPNAGYTFIGWWSGALGVNTNNFVMVTMDGNEVVTAFFRQRSIPASTYQPPAPKYQGGYGTFTDSRNGRTYKTVVIGGKTWMAENMNYQPQNGKSWCYNGKHFSCDKYGRLYDWNTAQEVCPSESGWHLPTRQEWDDLVKTAGGDKNAGKKLLLATSSSNTLKNAENRVFTGIFITFPTT